MADNEGKGAKSRRYIAAKTDKAPQMKAEGGKGKAEGGKIKPESAKGKNKSGEGMVEGNRGKSLPENGPITRQTNIMELVHEYPEAVPVLIEAGLHCIGCQLSMVDTVEAGCEIHGMDSETVDRLIKEMNERVKGFRK